MIPRENELTISGTERGSPSGRVVPRSQPPEAGNESGDDHERVRQLATRDEVRHADDAVVVVDEQKNAGQQEHLRHDVPERDRRSAAHPENHPAKVESDCGKHEPEAQVYVPVERRRNEQQDGAREHAQRECG
jgi:hypothetical protein